MKALAALAMLAAVTAAPGARTLDPMDALGQWQAKASDDVTTAASIVAGHAGKALRLDWDFHHVSGYAYLRRPLPLALADDEAISLWVRWTGGVNDLQIKLVDASGENVWWVAKPDVELKPGWQRLTLRKRDFTFAWGPTTDKALRRTASIEIVVARGRDGGKGSVDLDDLTIVKAPAAATMAPRGQALSSNAAIEALAAKAPRGTYPRGFSGEQSYWTLIGTDGGAASALIGEDGAVEVAKGGFSIEPCVEAGGKRFAWADVAATQSLAEGYLPIPSVEWKAPGWTLETRAFADPSVPKGRLVVRYTLRNTTRAPLSAKLMLAVRPFQVNPPAQFLSQQGGVSPITGIGWTGKALDVSGAVDPRTGKARVTPVLPLVAPDHIALSPTDQGCAALASQAPARIGARLMAKAGLASGAFVYPVALPAGGSRDFALIVPFSGAPTSIANVADAERSTHSYWRDRLNRVAITVPPARQALADTVRTSLAHILMSRDGAMLRPGTRSYARSWIRDGAMMSEALLRLGQGDVAARYADWYSPYRFTSGKIPCCVDFKGADPVPENDSQGEYVFLATSLYRYTGDRAALERHWPAILGAERYMETLRATTRAPGTEPWLRGLMPPSISHEGYSAKPQYSLWDDFWALRGYKDAAYAATLLGKPEAAEIARHRDAFERDLVTAIQAAGKHWRIGFIPGATSLGDFDATSTTVALSPGGAQQALDRAMLDATFDRYWRDFLARNRGDKAWEDYTPYELRTVSAMIRLGHRDRVDPLLDFFFAGRRPAAWNGWAEVVGHAPRKIRFIGDMPHAWIASDFIRSALDMFAYERDDGALVIGAGFSDSYLEGPGSSIRGLRTPHGTLDLALRATPARLSVTIGGMARPPGGFVLPWPWPTPPGSATIDGKPASFHGGALTIAATGRPITIEVAR